MVYSTFAQQPLTPEKLWELHRVSGIGLTADKNHVLIGVTTPNVKNNSFDKEYYKLAIKDGKTVSITKEQLELLTEKLNNNKSLKLIHKEVKLTPVLAKDFHKDLDKSSGKIYQGLDHRHWDKWNEGSYNHVFIENIASGALTDIMQGLPYYCPQEPHGGEEDYIWSPDGKKVLYVTKAKVGTQYVVSTNTDIYQYDIATKTTTNLTEGMMGYDTNPSFSKEGVLAWLSMKEDGNEADKNDLYILHNGQKINLTATWDNTVFSYLWSDDGKKIYFIAATNQQYHRTIRRPFSGDS